MEQENKPRWEFQIRRIKKTCADLPTDITMWGLFAEEAIPSGAFVVEYVGEIITVKKGDSRGRKYDAAGMSYLFDMNDCESDDEYDTKV